MKFKGMEVIDGKSYEVYVDTTDIAKLKECVYEYERFNLYGLTIEPEVVIANGKINFGRRNKTREDNFYAPTEYECSFALVRIRKDYSDDNGTVIRSIYYVFYV